MHLSNGEESSLGGTEGGSPSYFVYIKKVDDKSYKYKNLYIINERNIINIK